MFDSNVRRALYNTTSARALAIALGLSFAAGSAVAGGALPASGQYVAGKGSIAKSGSSGLTIDQSSATGIIDWNSFSIGRKNSVTFDNGSGATLNRVTGGNLSTIAGSLKATGSLYLINPQGMIVSGTGRVLTGGNFIGSSRDLSDDDFAHGKRRFTGTSKGAVVNQGTIRSSNGDVALIGSSASNSGILSASHGSASLDAGDNILLAPAGSGGHILVSGGSGDVTNSGTIAAAQAQLDAAGGNVYALSGNNGGIVRATGTSTIGGHVWLTSNSGNVSISGTIAATNANGSGGVVTARADNIVISGNINMSATKATMTGGTVSIVARNTTDVSGRIAAQGGDHGKGGFVETSGQHVHVEGSARITTLAKDGIAGDWLIDPNDFTIAASGGDITGTALSNDLKTGSVTIKSSQGATAGNGDIFVDDAVTWSSAHTLTLDAYRNIDINDAINISASGGLSLIYGDQAQTGTGNAADGGLLFNGGNIAFTNVTSGDNTALAINGQAYTLENTVAALSSAISSTPSGHYALANSYNDNNTSTTIATTFTGTLEGLGNTISNSPSLFTQIGDGTGNGVVRDLSLTVAAESGATEYLSGPDIEAVGGFAAVLSSGATLDNVSISGSLSLGGCQCQPTTEYSGGLVGYSMGTIKDSSSDTIISGGSGTNAGGLVGFNAIGGIIMHSSAMGSLDIISFGGNIGGLAEENAGTISYSSANESIGGSSYEFMAGGLVAQNDSGGEISNSYATGTIDGADGGPAGGLVGYNDGAIADSYALGTVQSYDSGDAGGLVGENSGSITNAYAMGNILGGDYVGGLVGDNEGTIANAYSTGVADGGKDVGGLVGLNSGTISHGFWDTQTSTNTKGIGSDSNNQAVTGQTTAQLQGSLPSGFVDTTWGTDSGLFPYFVWQYPSVPKAVTGTIFSDADVTTKRTDTVSLIVNGVSLGTVSRAGNGYYYFLVAPDAISDSNRQMLFTGFGGAALVQNAPSLNNDLNFITDALSVTTSSLTYSALNTALTNNLAIAVGNNTSEQAYINGLGLSITATGKNFEFDQSVNLGSDPLNIVASGSVTQSAPITAGIFTGSSEGSVTLTEANHIADLRAFSTGGNYAFDLTDANDLTVDGLVSTGTAQLTLTTTGSSDDITTSSTVGDLSRQANLRGGTVKLTSAGTISGNGEIQANVITGSSHGDAELEGIFTDLGNFNTNNGNLTVGDQRTLTTLGLVKAGSGSIEFGTETNQNIRIESHIETSGAASVVRLISGGNITETSAGALITHKLNAYANTGITLTSQANQISVLGTHKTNSGPNRVHT